MGPFDYIKAIDKKKDIMQSEQDEKVYSSFLINRQFSYFQDSIMLANEMNKNHHLPNNMQFHFYINTIRANKNRFTKWAKPTKDDDIEIIKQFYGYSNEKARYALTILTPEQVEELRLKVERRGKQKQ